MTGRVSLLIVGGVVLALIAFTGRPPRHVGDTLPSYRVPAARRADAERTAAALFHERGVLVDTLAFTAAGELRVVLAPGTYMAPTRFDRARRSDVICTGGEEAAAPLAPTAAVAYRAFGGRTGTARVLLVTQSDSAVRGGWFWRARCGPNTATRPFTAAELEPLLAAS